MQDLMFSMQEHFLWTTSATFSGTVVFPRMTSDLTDSDICGLPVTHKLSEKVHSFYLAFSPVDLFCLGNLG